MKRFLFLSLSLLFSSVVITFYPHIKNIKPFFPFINYLLGVNEPTTYIVLLGNDTEMRANGGFTGSYAKITLSNTVYKNFKLHTDNQISFQDIYVPNGQLEGYVSPPAPIQEAFGHGTWELANADWDPDFPTSAKNIRWFLEKGKETNPDLLVLLNLSTIHQILREIGPFPVPEYQATITPDNLYLFLQGKAEVNFFPGSTQKKDALTAVGQALTKKILQLPVLTKVKIIEVLYQEWRHQNLLVHSQNPQFQNFLAQNHLDGSLSPLAFDTYSLIETNLGANKANQFVDRQTKHTVTYQNQALRHEVQVNFTNTSSQANPHPPFYYGGHYITYLRLYLPETAKNIQINQSPNSTPSSTMLPGKTKEVIDAYRIDTSRGLTEVGFWHVTRAGDQTSFDLSYELFLPNPTDYNLAILKQNGFPASPQVLDIFGQTVGSELKQDFLFPKAL